MQYPFGPWEPDNTATNVAVVDKAEGVVPRLGGYGPFPQLVAADGAEALSGAPRGLKSIQKNDGSWKVYAATATKIEELQSDYTFDDIETGRTVTTGDDVSFCKFGKYLINTDTTSGMKAYDTELGGTNAAVSAGPSARAVFEVNNVLFALGTAANPRRMANSAIGDHTKWSGGAADGKTFETGGALVGGAKLSQRTAVVFQDMAIRGIQFGAGAANYAVEIIVDGKGCVSERCIVAFNGMIGWWDTNGPWLIRAGSAPVDIGKDKINDWASRNIGRLNYASMVGTYDPARDLMIWRVDSSLLLAFDVRQGRWSTLPASTTTLAQIAVPAANINSLSGTIDELSGSIDGLGGGAPPVLGGLNSSLKFATFSGSNMAAVVEGRAVVNPVTGLVTRATPIDDAASGTVQLGVSDRLDSAITWKGGEAKRTSGRVSLRGRGMNIAFRRTISAGATWSYANGIDAINKPSGGPR